MATNERIMFKR